MRRGVGFGFCHVLDKFRPLRWPPIELPKSLVGEGRVPISPRLLLLPPLVEVRNERSSSRPRALVPLPRR
eukprot:9427347-Pyramimonas_sp.AAC.1